MRVSTQIIKYLQTIPTIFLDAMLELGPHLDINLCPEAREDRCPHL